MKQFEMQLGHLCNNRCVFCFVDQSPAKMRRPLYLKDDDFRYSFLAANFVTLTNLSDDDWRKIKKKKGLTARRKFLLQIGVALV